MVDSLNHKYEINDHFKVHHSSHANPLWFSRQCFCHKKIIDLVVTRLKTHKMSSVILIFLYQLGIHESNQEHRWYSTKEVKFFHSSITYWYFLELWLCQDMELRLLWWLLKLHVGTIFRLLENISKEFPFYIRLCLFHFFLTSFCLCNSHSFLFLPIFNSHFLPPIIKTVSNLGLFGLVFSGSYEHSFWDIQIVDC